MVMDKVTTPHTRCLTVALLWLSTGKAQRSVCLSHTGLRAFVVYLHGMMTGHGQRKGKAVSYADLP
jgi:hypothetical protein